MLSALADPWSLTANVPRRKVVRSAWREIRKGHRQQDLRRAAGTSKPVPIAAGNDDRALLPNTGARDMAVDQSVGIDEDQLDVAAPGCQSGEPEPNVSVLVRRH